MRKIVFGLLSIILISSCVQQRALIEVNKVYQSSNGSVLLMLAEDSNYFYSQGASRLSYGTWKDEGDYIELNTRWKTSSDPTERDLNQVNSMFLQFEKVKLQNDNGDTVVLQFDSVHLIKLYAQDSIPTRIRTIRDEYYK